MATECSSGPATYRRGSTAYHLPQIHGPVVGAIKGIRTDKVAEPVSGRDVGQMGLKPNLKFAESFPQYP